MLREPVFFVVDEGSNGLFQSGQSLGGGQGPDAANLPRDGIFLVDEVEL